MTLPHAMNSDSGPGHRDPGARTPCVPGRHHNGANTRGNGAGAILPTLVPTDYVQLADVAGIPVPLPRVTLRRLLADGKEVVQLTIPLAGMTLADLDALPGQACVRIRQNDSLVPPSGTCLTIAEASVRLKSALDELSLPGEEIGLETARGRVRRACERGDLMTIGSGRHRRVDAACFDRWLTVQQNRFLNEVDARDADR